MNVSRFPGLECTISQILSHLAGALTSALSALIRGPISVPRRPLTPRQPRIELRRPPARACVPISWLLRPKRPLPSRRGSHSAEWVLRTRGSRLSAGPRQPRTVVSSSSPRYCPQYDAKPSSWVLSRLVEFGSPHYNKQYRSYVPDSRTSPGDVPLR